MIQIVDLWHVVVPGHRALYGWKEYSPDEGPLWLSSRVNLMSLMRNCWGGSR